MAFPERKIKIKQDLPNPWITRGLKKNFQEKTASISKVFKT